MIFQRWTGQSGMRRVKKEASADFSGQKWGNSESA
jgi:hypothetical protein